MKKHFVTGLAIVLPLALTYIAVILVIDLCTQPFRFLVASWFENSDLFRDGWWIFSRNEMLSWTVTVAILFGLLIASFFIGLIASFVIVHYFVRTIDRVLLKIPFLRYFYRACRDVIRMLLRPSLSSLHVAWVPSLVRNHRSLGVVTNELEVQFVSGKEQFVAVFIPGSPNPTAGLLFLCPRNSVVSTDLRVQSVMKWIFSCGSLASTSVTNSFTSAIG